MMEEISINESDTNRTDDSFGDDDDNFEPPAERWAPIGASAPTPTPSKNETKNLDGDRLLELEEEQEQLNASLLTLTTHFAQVQFRLQQIGKAEPAEKEHLLKDLEEFAFKGCPDIMEVKQMQKKFTKKDDTDIVNAAEHETIMKQQRAKQLQLIGQLKDQLEDIERFAYETGDGDLPSGEVMEKQKVIIDQLRERMELDLELDKLSPDELQKHVDLAVKRLINPMKIKEHLVQQLQTQITDLERFVEFLQGEGSDGTQNVTCTCENEPDTCLLHRRSGRLGGGAKSFGYNQPDRHRRKSVMENTVSLLQLYVLANLGCQSNKFHRNELKKTSKGNHWGDLRAALEMAVDKLMEVMEKHQMLQQSSPATLNPYNSDEDDVDDVFDKCHEEIVTAVRKDLCPALRDLLQHGLLSQQSNISGSSIGNAFGCFPTRSKRPPSPSIDSGIGAKLPEQPTHAWDILAGYYDMKHGREYSDAPVRKLSQSFNLDNIGGRAVTSKQMLLTTIDNIQTTHAKLKRSPDAMFKAFISAALNHKKLVPWLRMILRTREVVEENYHNWSYVAKSGFEDSLLLLEKLHKYTFNLPVDLAVRPFQHIKDAF